MTTAELTLCLTAFNTLAVPLMLTAWKWTKRVERRLARLEHELKLEHFVTT